MHTRTSYSSYTKRVQAFAYTYFREFVTGIFIDDPGKSTSSSTTSNGICRGILIIDVIFKKDSFTNGTKT